MQNGFPSLATLFSPTLPRVIMFWDCFWAEANVEANLRAVFDHPSHRGNVSNESPAGMLCGGRLLRGHLHLTPQWNYSAHNPDFSKELNGRGVGHPRCY